MPNGIKVPQSSPNYIDRLKNEVTAINKTNTKYLEREKEQNKNKQDK